MSGGEDRVGAVQQTVLRTFGGYHAVRGHLADLQAGNVPPKDKPGAFHFGLLNVLANNFKELCDAYDALYNLYTATVQDRGKLVSKLATLQGTEAIRVQFLEEALGIFEAIGNRCMAADGPVTPVTKEITGEELERVYKLVRCAHGGYPIVCQSSEAKR